MRTAPAVNLLVIRINQQSPVPPKPVIITVHQGRLTTMDLAVQQHIMVNKVAVLILNSSRRMIVIIIIGNTTLVTVATVNGVAIPITIEK